jgi:hypothetical protein
MKGKLLLFGEAAPIPKIPIKLGVGFISGWIHNNGFTSATNDLGAICSTFLKTPELDVEEQDDKRQRRFSNLHNQIATFETTPSMFVKSRGNARASTTVGIQEVGRLSVARSGLQLTTVPTVGEPLNFSVIVAQVEKNVAGVGCRCDSVCRGSPRPGRRSASERQH